MAAKEICNTFQNYYGNSLLEAMNQANRKIKILNDQYIPICDYLENDYYGAVCSCVSISKNILNWAYICDCGVLVYDKNGNIKFQTEDDKLKVDSYIDNSGMLWNLPSGRVMVRKNYRNKPNFYIDGNLASYGAFTGEIEVNDFIKCGSLSLEKGDIILVYSDGFTEYFKRSDFYKSLMNVKKNSKLFDDYVEKISLLDYQKYGKEKTIVVLEVDF